MRTYLVLGIAAALVGAACGACDACVDGRCLKKHILPEDSGNVGAIGRIANVYYVTAFKNNQDFITQCNLNTLTCNDSANIWDLSDFTVDQRTGDVYAAGSGRKGIYKVDLLKNERVLVVDEKVTCITFTDKLYYASEKGGIYTFDGGIQRIVPGTEGFVAMVLVVDKNEDIYFENFYNETVALRKLKNGTATLNYFLDRWNYLNVDKDGYTIAFDLISYAVYRVINDELVEVGAVTDKVFEPLFDGDNNLIYTREIDRYYLKQVPDVQCSTNGSGLGRLQRQIIAEPVTTNTPGTVGPTTFTDPTPAH